MAAEPSQYSAEIAKSNAHQAEFEAEAEKAKCQEGRTFAKCVVLCSLIANTLFFRSCDSGDYNSCVSNAHTPAECRAASWP